MVYHRLPHFLHPHCVTPVLKRESAHVAELLKGIATIRLFWDIDNLRSLFVIPPDEDGKPNQRGDDEQDVYHPPHGEETDDEEYDPKG